MTETAIQWGKFNNNETVVEHVVPAINAPKTYPHVNTNYFFITSYNYAFPEKNNGVTTGYAFYSFNSTVIGTKIWYRKPIYFNNITTQATNVDILREIQEKHSFPSLNTVFNCMSSLNARK